MLKHWNKWLGTDLNINGLGRGPEYLAILHLAVNLFIFARDNELKNKIKFGNPKSFIDVEGLNKHFSTTPTQLESALEILTSGNFFVITKINDGVNTGSWIGLSEAAKNHIKYDEEFRENTRDRLMYYLVIGASIG